MRSQCALNFYITFFLGFFVFKMGYIFRSLLTKPQTIDPVPGIVNYLLPLTAF